MSVLMVAGVIAAAAALTPARATANTAVSVSFFYSSLAPYGDWFDYPPYGWCWSPAAVSADWRPYSDGHWVYTDYGWTWVDNEPWGWAPFHYGRWLFDPDYGWVWVPGTQWAPSWVAWRSSDECIGWAALPPAGVWTSWNVVSYGSVDRIPEREWCFVRPGRLVDRDLRRELLPVSRSVDFVARTRPVTRFGSREGRPVNLGIDVATFQRAYGRAVPHTRITDAPRPVRGRPADGAVAMFRPKVTGMHSGARPPQSAIDRREAPRAIARGMQGPETHVQPGRQEHTMRMLPELRHAPEPRTYVPEQPPSGRGRDRMNAPERRPFERGPATMEQPPQQRMNAPEPPRAEHGRWRSDAPPPPRAGAPERPAPQVERAQGPPPSAHGGHEQHGPPPHAQHPDQPQQPQHGPPPQAQEPHGHDHPHKGHGQD